MARGDEPDLFEYELVEHADPRIFTTNPDSPEDGRTFVWAETRWYERVQGDEDGGVLFPHVAEEEGELREWLSQEGLDLTELDDDFSLSVREEFLDQEPLYPEAPELSNQPLAPE